MSNLPDIDFEGKVVKAVNGVYKCPYNCGDSRYPAKKWKTEKGFRQHMINCRYKPSAMEEKEKAAAECRRQQEEKKQKLLEQIPYKIGDEIICVREIVVESKYKNIGNRTVKVRYENKCRYEPARCKIHSFDYFQGTIFINGSIRIIDIRESWEQAVADAKRTQFLHDKWLEECASYR